MIFCLKIIISGIVIIGLIKAINDMDDTGGGDTGGPRSPRIYSI